MKKAIFALLAVLVAATAFAQAPAQLLDQIDAASKALRAQLTPPAPQATTVPAGGDLQAALDAGGTVTLQGGATYAGAFVLRVPGTVLDCAGATLLGPKGAPALDIPPGAHDIAAQDCTLSTADDQRVVIVGRNDANQATLDRVPRRIRLTRLHVPTYRGKRAYELHGADLVLDGATCADLYDPAGRDSQCVGISANTPGPVSILNGDFSGGSEVVLVGGALPTIPGLVPEDITIQGNHVWHPLGWQTDGVKRVLKNLIELKTGRRVSITNNLLDGSWKDGQDGYAFVLTPHAGGDIHDVTIDSNAIDHVGACIQILGQEYAVGSPVTPSPLSGLRFAHNTCRASNAYASTLAVAAGITGAPIDVTFDGNTFVLEGSRIVGYSAGTVLTADGTTTQPAGPMAALVFTGNRVAGGMTYSFMLQGVANAGPTQQGVTTLTITGNTFADAPSALKKNQPQNTYITRVAWDALVSGGQ